ncbi:MAG: HNH endonuclease [Myxococcota bacterium]
MIAAIALMGWLGKLWDKITGEELVRQQEKERNRQGHEKWLRELEPMYRNSGSEFPHDDYPPDWQVRRAMVYDRAEGTCERCGKPAGKYIGDLSHAEDLGGSWTRGISVIQDAHVHHKVPISKGGNHSLNNLELLHEWCHDFRHWELRNLSEDDGD